MTITTGIRGRLAAASGVLVTLGWGVAGAAMVGVIVGNADFHPASVPFDIRVTGAEADRLSADAVWAQGNPVGVDVEVADGDAGLAPGSRRTYAIGVQNASSEASAAITMTIVDPDSADIDLFDAIEFTVECDGRTLLDGVAGSDLAGSVPLGVLAASEHAELTVTLALPQSVDNRYNGAYTRVSIEMRGENR
ncbi:hypothetical protein [Homoserinibacter sp. GY 40078]|uniref:hypothetical protein n=1 Tax=Homoserinibacter sp. GY 40078 TaxID=2603275 RepID=UPI0011CB0CC9|nr:hypothetical protein [Homoserinibacter sp. GY 40078]TXK18541.1 hypothetical protein FVQ89_00865 [Homoserinibacter sp. GY 40078]